MNKKNKIILFSFIISLLISIEGISQNNHFCDLKRANKNIQNAFILELHDLDILDSSILNLINLKELYIYNKKFNNDKLPEFLFELKSLELLSIINTPIDIKSFENINKLQKLRQLILTSNNLSNFPMKILQIDSLKILNITNNHITTIPKDIKRLNLSHLSLSKNKLKSISPLYGLKKLYVLDLSNNNIEKIKNKIKKLKRLQKLYLDSNNIKKLPAGICKLTAIEKLQIYNNPIKKIPKDIYKLEYLKRIDIGNTKIKLKNEKIGSILIVK